MESPLTTEELLAHAGWMRRLARSLVRDDSLADDLVQETLLAAVKRPPRASRALGAWLRTVLRNFAFRRQVEERSRRRREQLASRPEVSTAAPGELIERVERQRELVDLVCPRSTRFVARTSTPGSSAVERPTRTVDSRSRTSPAPPSRSA